MLSDYPLIFHLTLLIFSYALSCWAVVHAVLHKNNPRAALGWVVLSVTVPGIGALVYFAVGIDRAESRAARLMRAAQLKVPQGHDALHGRQGSRRPPGHVRSQLLRHNFIPMARIGKTLTGRPLSGGNAIKPLYNGDEAYPAMLAAIDKAESHVYLTTYIFTAGDVSKALCESLADAAERGVDVRLIIDGLGGRLYSLPRMPFFGGEAYPWRSLRERGVQVAEFLPPRLWPPNFAINLRNHRKILVADNMGFTGGMNIADYHVRNHKKFSVQDVHFLCHGPIVAQLCEAFLLDWGFCTNDYRTTHTYKENMCGDVLCRMVLDGPGSGKDPLHELLYGVMAAAQKSICIVTPYFLPTQACTAALKAAALRGVDVRIILPAKNNHFYVHAATMHLLPKLLESGVQILLQPPPFAHTKLLIVDNYYAQIGSANLDSRSLRLNFELNVECFDTSFARKMQLYFNKLAQRSMHYSLEDAQKTPFLYQLRNGIFWMFSPYL